ncbi:MAG: sulfotransferase [Candidatus Electrothrix sp. GM3_4]|nr:sulfotransferase [Candidatus Electrothrix sp. GM3_4]
MPEKTYELANPESEIITSLQDYQFMNESRGSVCIVGYPRSGTTLVYHLLMSAEVYPVFTFDETHYFSHFYKMYGDLRKQANLTRLLNDLKTRGIVDDLHSFEKDIIKRLGRTSVSYESLFAMLMTHLAGLQGKTMWVEKTPWHMSYLKEIVRACPSVKIIFLVRDPRAVALSIDRAGWIPKGNVLRAASGWRWHMARTEKLIEVFDRRVLTVK